MFHFDISLVKLDVDVLCVKCSADGSISSFFHGGKVKGNGRIECMKEQVQFFSTPPSFHGLVSHC